MTTLLQSLVLPNLAVGADEDLYLRCNAQAWCELGTPRLHFMPGGVARTDTFYNGFSVGPWKRWADPASLLLRLQGEGDFVVSFGLHRVGREPAWLAEQALVLRRGKPLHLPLQAWSGLAGDGLLFVRLRSLERGLIEAADWVSADAPRRDVRLGLVITHFNRQAQVLPAIERIRAQLLERPDLRGRITLTVVDNSADLALQPHPAVTHLPSRNFGGSGGFSRGLLELMDGGLHTHALFMDDDASCEAESIARAFALLRMSREPRLAIAGALLREVQPWRLLEKGARFDGQVRPLLGGLDLRRVDDLLQAERSPQTPDYGAWWFFAFPLAEVKRFPFPFFVRGDDVLFGLDNRFLIATLNGVACLGEDFAVKASPLTAYLDARYHLVLALLKARSPGSRLSWIAAKLFAKQLGSYNYSSARAVTLALQHVLRGPEVFREQLDLQDVRAEIAAWTPSEKMLPLERSGFELTPARRHRESRWRTLARLLTLQGFLLPGPLLKDRTTVQEKAFHGRAPAVFRYRRVLYLHEPSSTGYLAEYDRRRFFAEARSFLRSYFALRRRLPQLAQAFRAAAEELTSEAFWRGVHGRPAPPPAQPLPTDVAPQDEAAAEPARDAVEHG